MTDHRAILSTFLRTDLYRIEAALEDAVWNDAIAARLNDHVQRLAAVLALLTDNPHTVKSLTDTDSTIEILDDVTDALLSAIAAAPDSRLDAPVLDRHDRNLTVLAHLYDYTRLSAMLVEWCTALPTTSTVDDWFNALDDTP